MRRSDPLLSCGTWREEALHIHNRLARYSSLLSRKLYQHLTANIPNQYLFTSGYHSGHKKEMEDETIMQETLLQAGSTLLILFPVPEGFQINRPLSAKEKSLTVKYASNVGGNIGTLVVASLSEIHIQTISVVTEMMGDA